MPSSNSKVEGEGFSGCNPSPSLLAAPSEGWSCSRWLFPAAGHVGSRTANFLSSSHSGQPEEPLEAERLEWGRGLWDHLSLYSLTLHLPSWGEMFTSPGL